MDWWYCNCKVDHSAEAVQRIQIGQTRGGKKKSTVLPLQPQQEYVRVRACAVTKKLVGARRDKKKDGLGLLLRQQDDLTSRRVNKTA